MFCTHCERDLPTFRFCPVCGNPPGPQPNITPQNNPYQQSPPPQYPPPNQPPSNNYYNNNYYQNNPGLQYKSESTTLILSIVLGLLALPGIGHMYVGKVGKGIGILIGSWILIGIAIVTFGIGLIIYLILFIWQIIDSRNLCRQYNQYLSQNGRQPW